MKLTKEQRKLLEIFKDEYLTSGDICQEYHKDNIAPTLIVTEGCYGNEMPEAKKNRYRRLKYSMKRNSQISSWLSKLESKGLVRKMNMYYNGEFTRWFISDYGKKLLEEKENG